MTRKSQKLVILELLANRTPPVSRAEVYAVLTGQWENEDGAALETNVVASALSALVTYGLANMRLAAGVSKQNYSKRHLDTFTLTDKGRAFLANPLDRSGIKYLVPKSKTVKPAFVIPWKPYGARVQVPNLEHVRLAKAFEGRVAA